MIRSLKGTIKERTVDPTSFDIPTIYKDGNEWVTDYDIEIIGTPRRGSYVLPAYTIVKQVGSNVKVASFIKLENDEIPDDLFKYAFNVIDLSNCFTTYGCVPVFAKSIPDGLFDSCNKVTSFSGVFAYFLKIKSIPEGLFKNCPNVTAADNMFKDCRSLEEIPEDLFASFSNATSYNSVFGGCESLKHIPENLFATSPKATDFQGAFCNCKGIEEIPAKLFANNPDIDTLRATFSYCDNLVKVPPTLLDSNTKITDFNDTFYRCKSIEDTENGDMSWLWKPRQNDPNINARGCFTHCNNTLENYDNIPDDWK